MKVAGIVALGVSGIVVAGGVVSGTAGPSTTAQPTSGGPAVAVSARPRFTAGRVTNPWFPLNPGTRFVYRGFGDGAPTRDVVYVRHATRVIDGVTCRAVSDRLFTRGHLAERTTDWYAQSTDGRVWYFGERTAELDRTGRVTSREGSWLAGRDGARAGIFMDARPRVGQTHFQEYYKGHAEDRYQVIDVSGSVSEPLLVSHHAVVTREWSPLEPGVVSRKFYVRDIGNVGETSVKGPKETDRLVSVAHVR